MRRRTSLKLAVTLTALLGVGVASSAAPMRTRKVSKGRTSAARGAAQAKPLVARGLENLRYKEYTAAIASFEKAVRAHGDSATYFLLGWAHYQRGFSSGDPTQADQQDAQETVNAYLTALALEPDLAAVKQPHRLYHSMALSYEALNQADKALDAYRRAIAAAPSNPMLPLYAARLRFQRGESDKAASNLSVALKKAAAIGQERKILDLLRADRRFNPMLASAQVASVARNFDPSLPSPSNGALVAQARPALDPDAAGDGVRDAVRGTTPFEAKPAMREQDKAVLDELEAANAEFRFRRYGAAIEAYHDVLALNQRSAILSPAQLGLVFERIGTSYNKLGNSSQAIHALQRSVQELPMNAAAHYQLSLSYAVSGRYQQSLRALREAFHTAPSGGELKRFMLLSKTDQELEGVRDLPAFRSIVGEFSERSKAVR